MGRHLWLMHCLLPLVIGLSTPPKPLPLAERPQAAEQIVTPGELDRNYHIVSHVRVTHLYFITQQSLTDSLSSF